jgi:TolA-binding protein
MSVETTESTGWIDFLAWLEVNKQRLFMAAALLGATGIGFAVMQNSRAQKEVEASTMLLKLHVPMNAPTNAPAIPASAFTAVAAEFGGTSASERASFLAAGLIYNEGKYPEAHAEFTKFLGNFASSAWAPTAALGLAASLEAQGKADEALTAYRSVASIYPSSSVVDTAKFSEARIYQAKNQPDQALKVYDDLLKPTNTSMRSGEAQQSRESLLKKFPNLVKAVAVPTVSLTNGVPVK